MAPLPEINKMVCLTRTFYTTTIFLTCIKLSTAMIEGLYCGKRNCYDVLEVTRDTPKQEIAKNYRRLAKKYHPDMHKTKIAKEKAEENFQLIATAYEILKDEEARKDYNYMLDNPEEVYRHYFHYYRHRMAPKVDIKIVIAVSITVISIIQYLSACHRYTTAINYLVSVPKYRLKALDVAKNEGLIDGNKKKGRKTKEELREEEDGIIRLVLEENMDIRGGYAKPKISDVLWIQLFCLPYTIFVLIWFNLRKYFKCSSTQWQAVNIKEKNEFLKLELWDKEKFDEWSSGGVKKTNKSKN